MNPQLEETSHRSAMNGCPSPSPSSAERRRDANAGDYHQRERAELRCLDAEAHAELGMALLQAGALAEAAATFEKALRLRPEWVEVQATLAITLQQLGQGDEAVAAYRQALTLDAEDARAHSNLGVLLQTLGRSAEAVECLRRAIDLEPAFAEAHANLGVTLRSMGQFAPAIAALQQAVELKPTYAEAHANLGSCLHALGRVSEAATSLRVATILNPQYVEAFQNLGVVLHSLGRPGDAASACRSAIGLGLERADVYLLMGVALQDIDRQDEALAAYRRAIDIDPTSADAYSNLGVVLLEQSRHDEAISAFRKASAILPTHRHACANLSIALHEQGRDDEAAECFERALATNSEDADVYSNFAMLRIHQARFEDALVLLARAAALNQDHGRPLPERVQIPGYRVKHDREQLQLLRQRGLINSEFVGYVDCIESIAQRCSAQERTNAVTVEGAEVAHVAPSYNRLVHLPRPPTFSAPYLNPALEIEKIERQYLESKPEVVSIDDFLAPSALAALRNFCLEATVWKKEYPNGYLGATLKDGFASPLLLHIAEDLRLRFPRIFGQHLLEQAWAFKYDSTMKGINVHADFARVNVNFWITPDEACSSPDRGGLIVWDKESPRDWSFQKYNGDEAHIRRFLSQSGAKAIRIPYRANRCVLFNSTLFHETDRFEFNDAYEDRRVNVTLLYGKGLKMR